MTSSATGDPPTAPTRARWILLVIAAFTSLFGLVVLTGWLIHSPVLIRVHPEWPPMQFNTAVCFVLAGLALGLWAQERRRFVAPILGNVIALLSGLTMAEYLTHLNLGIDQLLFHSSLGGLEIYPGRMSAISAFCLLLVGIGLVLLCVKNGQQNPWIAGVLASLVVSAAVIALLGYVLGLPGAYHWGQLTRIAPHTALGYVVLGGGLAFAAWQIGCQPGERTPRWLPAPLALGVITGTLVLFFATDDKQNEELQQSVRLGSASVQREVTQRLENRARALTRMARRWEYAGHPTQDAWEHEAGLYTHDFPDIQAVEWIDASGHVRWIVPVAENAAKIDLNAAREDRRAAAMERARVERHAVFSGAVTLFRGGLGVIIYTPINSADGKFDGWIAGVFVVQSLLDRYLPKDIATDQAIQLSDHGQIFYTRYPGKPPSAHPEWTAREMIELPGARWDLLVYPTPALTAHTISALPVIVLLVGSVDALLLAGICRLAQRHSRVSRARAATAVALQRALDEVKTLKGLLPICSCCKRVRDDTGYWSQIDTYLHRHTDAKLSHGYCPECAAKAYVQFGLDVPEGLRADLAARNFE